MGHEDDVLLTRESFEEAEVPANLHHVEDGQECLAFLRKEGSYAHAPTPDLLILDLNMPVMDGREVLAELVTDDALQHLPVVILTTSAHEKDVAEMYRLRCSTYLVKPLDFDRFAAVIRTLGTYWFRYAVLPS